MNRRTRSGPRLAAHPAKGVSGWIAAEDRGVREAGLSKSSPDR